MPLLKRRPFSLLESPNDLEPRELVFQIRYTKEIFRDYEEYLKRINLYRQRAWTCKVTGKGNLTYEEALISEQCASEKVQKIPEELIGPILRVVQYSMLPLSDLVRKIKADVRENLAVGVEAQGKKDGGIQACKIVKVIHNEAGNTRYEVAWFDVDAKTKETTLLCKDDIIGNAIPFGREVLKSFIRESTYRNIPWVIHNNLATKHEIPSNIPETLRDKFVSLNGCVVKRKNNEGPQNGCNGKIKRRKLENGESNGSITDDGGENGDKSKYPIDDQLVEPGPDDPVFTDRPSPSRDFTIQMELYGDLLMIWDFCSCFGKLLFLWPYTVEDLEKSLCHKDGNISIIVETHSALLRLLMKDEREYYIVLQKKKRKSKITLSTWTEYLCDFIEMAGISDGDITTHLATIRRGHYGLLDPAIKLRFLKELVDHVVATHVVREKLDENLEQRLALGAEKRSEALEEGKMKREAKARLKAVAEANGTTLEGSSSPAQDITSNGNGWENGHVDKISPDLKQSLENGESGQNSSGLREKTKKLLDNLERSKEQRVEFLQKELEKHVIRTNSLGRDREYNRYWFFRRDGRVLIESSDSKQWGYYCSTEEVDAFMGSLNLKGERERALKRQLDKHYSRISKGLQKRSKDTANRIEEEDEAIRRSSRVRAPPKDNPALSFLKYSNKWKVLMG